MTIRKREDGRTYLDVEEGSPADTVDMVIPNATTGEPETFTVPTNPEKQAVMLDAALRQVRALQASGKVKTNEGQMALRAREHDLVGKSADATLAVRQHAADDAVRDALPAIMSRISAGIPFELYPEGSPEREAFVEQFRIPAKAALQGAAGSGNILTETEIQSISSRIGQAAAMRLGQDPAYTAWEADRKRKASLAAKPTLEERIAGAREDVAVGTATAQALNDPSARGPRDEAARTDAIRGAMPGQERARSERADATRNAEAQAKATVAGQSVIDRLVPKPTTEQTEAAAAQRGKEKGIATVAEASAKGTPIPGSKEDLEMRADASLGTTPGETEGPRPDSQFADGARSIARSHGSDPKKYADAIRALWRRIYGTEAPGNIEIADHLERIEKGN